MPARRSSQLAIAFGPEFPREADWATPVPAAGLTSAYPATSRDYIEEDETVEETYDCTGEDLLFELLTGRLARLRITMDVDPKLFAGWVAFAYGVTTTPIEGAAPYSHLISRLMLYDLPTMTLYVGFRNSSRQPVIFKHVVVDEIRCRSRAREKVTADVSLIGSADLVNAVGFTMPACQDIVPVRFGDCQVLLNAVDQSTLMREFEYYYQNNVLTGDNPFTGNSIDVQRLQRADRRPSGFNLGFLGEPGDAIWVDARAKTVMPIALRVGPVGNNITFRAPAAALKLDRPQIRFEGEANESNIRVVGQPRKVSGNAATPSNVTAYNTQANPYMAVVP